MSDLTIIEDSQILIFPLSVLYDLLIIDQISGASLMSFVLSRSTKLLWATRHFKPAKPKPIQKKFNGVLFNSDRDIVKRLTNSAFFAQLDKERLPDLLKFSELLLFPANGEKLLLPSPVRSFQMTSKLLAGRQRFRIPVNNVCDR